MATGTFKIEDMMTAIEQFQTQQRSFLVPGTLLLPPKMRRALEASTVRAGPAADENPIATGYRQTLMGFDLEIADIPPQTVYDWSGCRSPARAQRRHKLGHPQRAKIIHKDVAYFVDKAAVRRISDDWQRRAYKMLFG